MRVKKLAVFAISSVVLSLSVGQFASAESTYFTYTYDYWDTAQDSPDAYGVSSNYYGGDFGVENFKSPQSLFAYGNEMYVCDTGNNRIMVLEYVDNKLVWKQTIDEYFDPKGLAVVTKEDLALEAEAEKAEQESASEGETGEEGESGVAPEGETETETEKEAEEEKKEDKEEEKEDSEEKDSEEKDADAEEGEGSETAEDNGKLHFSKPYDVFVNDQYIYIAETGHYRILILNKEDLTVDQVIKNPQKQDESLQKKKFTVKKLVVDDTGRIYCLAEGVNQGLMCFDPKGDMEKYPNGKFTGFIGANRVTYTLWQRFWKTFATRDQIKRMINFVPTEYNNIALTKEGFYMVTTDVFDQWKMQSGDVLPVRKLNAMGSDILIRNGYTNPIGDLSPYWGNAGGYNGSSRFVDCVAMENETYYLLDRIRGRIFAYDSQGDLLYAFGGPGNKEGYMMSPAAIEAIGDELFVLDSLNCSITCYALTDYGRLINQAIDTYQEGKYDESAEYWEDVQTYNGNYALSYIGIGRARLRQKDYKGAMKNFKVAYDFDNYSKAFKHFRKEWIEKNVAWLFGIAIVLMVTPLAFQRIRRFVEEVNEVE
ncbi:MAG: hypothetical protein J5825_01700 [Lachnospiraceae bacterium]|nr:hypothetical protein [Lachnospiraceae bacterium]